MNPPSGTLSLQDAAKLLMSRGIKTGPQLLFHQLRGIDILNRENLPYTDYIDAKWFKIENSTWLHKNDKGEKEKIPYCRTFITDKGLSKIEKILTVKEKQTPYILPFENCVLGF
jgi:phage antirepressor YoqD-like protein